MVDEFMRLAVVVEAESEWRWLTAFDFAQAAISSAVFHYPEKPPSVPNLGGRVIGYEIHPGPLRLALPDFAEIVKGLEEEAVEACLIFGDGPLARLTATAADLLSVPLFSLVATLDQLTNLVHRGKSKPDLFFLADARLFSAALSDPRYGSTLLPTGHPGRDLLLRGNSQDGVPDDGVPDDGAPFDDPCFGDGQAATRIVSMIRRWRHDTIAPAEPDLSIVVPAFNEAENMSLVCDRLLDAFENEPITVEILLVDDASEDDTYRLAQEQMWRSPSIRALTKPLPRGMGHAIRYGLRRARSQIIAVTMGDGSDEVARIPEMFRQVRDAGMYLAIGSRYRYRRNYQNVPRLYRFWSFCFRLTTRILIGLKLSDYTNSFRVYHRDVFKQHGPESGGFEISPETTFKAWFAARRVVEVDVCHLKRATGQSNFSFLRAGPGYAKVLFKAFVNRLTGRWFIIEW